MHFVLRSSINIFFSFCVVAGHVFKLTAVAGDRLAARAWMQSSILRLPRPGEQMFSRLRPCFTANCNILYTFTVRSERHFLKHDEEDVISVKLQDFIRVAASHWCIVVWLTVMDASVVGEKALMGTGLPLAQLFSLVCTLEWPSFFFCLKTRRIANRVLSWHEITDRPETSWRIVLLPKTLRHPAAQWKVSAVRRRHIHHVWSAVCLRKGELHWVFSCRQTLMLWDFSMWPRSINSWMLILCLWRVLN